MNETNSSAKHHLVSPCLNEMAGFLIGGEMRVEIAYAMLAGAGATVLFEGLTFTHWKNGGVKALGPAIDVVEKVDPNCFAKPCCHLKTFVASLLICESGRWVD